MSRRDRREEDSDRDDAPRRGGGRLKWLALPVALGALGWFAPAIVASLSLLPTIIGYAAPDLAGKIQIQSASLGWLSPIDLHGVNITDLQGEPLAQIDGVRSQNTLWGLLTGGKDLGAFDVHEPRVRLVVRPDGSNLEDFLQRIKTDVPQEEANAGVSVICHDGTIELLDGHGQHHGTISQLNVSVDHPRDAAQPLMVKAAGVLADHAQAPAETPPAGATNDPLAGYFDVQLTWAPAPPSAASASASEKKPPAAPAGNLDLKLKTQQLPVEALAPLLRRFTPDVNLVCRVTSDANCAYRGSDQEADVTAAGEIVLSDLDLSSHALLGADRFRLASIRLAGQAGTSGGRVQLERCLLASDVVNLEVTGGATLKDLLAEQNVRTIMQTLSRENFRVTGRADLARLAQLLPQTLRIRADTQITSGQVDLALASEGPTAGSDQDRRWTAQLATSRLSANTAGRRIDYEQPIELRVAARHGAQGLALDELICRSSFLIVTGQGSLDEAKLSVEGDLDKLAGEVQQFIDLAGIELAGKLHGDFDGRRGQDQSLTASGEILLENFRLALPGMRPWSEERLHMTVAALGSLEGTRLARVDSGQVELKSGDDQFIARLTEKIDDVSRSMFWPVEVTVRGGLETWLPRIQALAPLEGWQIAGRLDATGQLEVSPERASIRTAKVGVADLMAVGPGLYIDEPVVEIETSGSWDKALGRIVSPATTLASTSCSLRAIDVDVVLAAGDKGTVAGDVAYRGDLARLARWVQPSRTAPDWSLAGQASGRIKLARAGNLTRGDLSSEVTDLVFSRVKPAPAPGSAGAPIQPAAEASPWETVWSEAKLTVAGEGTYAHSEDILSLRRCELASALVQLSALGNIERLTSRATADLRGEIDYDLEKVAQWLRAYYGAGLEVTGHDKRKFVLRGPLLPEAEVAASAVPGGEPAAAPVVSRELTGEASLGWTSANVRGLAVGAGVLEAKLADGMLRVTPTEIPVSDGRVKLGPVIRLNPGPPLLIVDRGQLVDKVRLSPELCEGWLMYVAPALANATRIDGRFSVDMAGAQVPLAEPATSNVAGVLSIHGAQVRPGPGLEPVVGLAQQLKAIIDGKPPGTAPTAIDLVRMNEQRIEFQMVQGRVYHKGMELLIDNVVVRTHGSVGLDQSVSLLAEIPILDEWTARGPVLASLKGQTLQIPIEGSLSQFRPDGRAVAQLVGQMARGTAVRALEGELNKQLDRLFGPKK